MPWVVRRKRHGSANSPLALSLLFGVLERLMFGTSLRWKDSVILSNFFSASPIHGLCPITCYYLTIGILIHVLTSLEFDFRNQPLSELEGRIEIPGSSEWLDRLFSLHHGDHLLVFPWKNLRQGPSPRKGLR